MMKLEEDIKKTLIEVKRKYEDIVNQKPKDSNYIITL